MKKTKEPLKNSLNYSSRVEEYILNMMRYYDIRNMNALPLHTRKQVVTLLENARRGKPIITAQQRNDPDTIYVTQLSVVDDFNGGKSWLIGSSDGIVLETHNIDLHVKDAYKNGERVTLEALIGHHRPIFAF